MSPISVPNTTWLRMIHKVLVSMSPLSICGELRLVTAIIAEAIYEDMMASHRCNTEPFRQSFFRENFPAYCRLIGLDHDQVREMVLDSWQYVRVDK